MDDEARQALASMKMPRRPINFVPASSGEILKLGHITCRIMEDGSRTDNRIGSAEFTLPPNTPGPPAHWHEMHDETFLVTQGVVRVCLLFIVILILTYYRYHYYVHCRSYTSRILILTLKLLMYSYLQTPPSSTAQTAK